MDMVAKEAELGKASLYYYYPTKQDLFADIVSQAAVDLSEGMAQVLEPGPEASSSGGEGTPGGTEPDVEEALCSLERILGFALDYFGAHRELLALFLPLIAGGPGRLEDMVGPEVARRVFDAHAPVFRRLEPLGRLLSPGNRLSSLVSSLLIGMATKVLYGPETDLQEEKVFFVNLLRRALREQAGPTTG